MYKCPMKSSKVSALGIFIQISKKVMEKKLKKIQMRRIQLFMYATICRNNLEIS